MLKATRERLEAQGVDVKGGAVKDIHNGTVLMELGGAKSGRLAALDAGYVANESSDCPPILTQRVMQLPRFLRLQVRQPAMRLVSAVRDRHRSPNQGRSD